MSWYEELEGLRAQLGDRQGAGKFPQDFQILVEPAPTDLDALRRISKRLPAVFLSIEGGAGQEDQAEPVTDVQFAADIYCRIGRSPQVERNALAAVACEQLHYFLKHPKLYCTVSDNFGRPQNVRFANLSYSSGADREGVAYWRVQWASRIESEELKKSTLAALTKITIAADGSELGGGPHDAGDDESTEVNYP